MMICYYNSQRPSRRYSKVTTLSGTGYNISDLVVSGHGMGERHSRTIVGRSGGATLMLVQGIKGYRLVDENRYARPGQGISLREVRKYTHGMRRAGRVR